MCPWRINAADPARIVSYPTVELCGSDIQHLIGKLYQTNITCSVGFTLDGCHLA